MTSLVIAEHNNSTLLGATYNTIAAAVELNADVHLLVAGNDCMAVAEQAAKAEGVNKVIVVQDSSLTHLTAESITSVVMSIASNYEHLLAGSTTFGKNFIPRVAALLDVAQISDITAVESSDTFIRPIYAGNAIATVKSNDSVKVLTVRSTGFDALALDGGNAEIEEHSCSITDS
ncbi:MAG: electron transfer flavoprotein alpha subunit, partial [Enterobacterales bacterium]